MEKKKIEELRKALENYDNILIGAGAGISTAAGFDYSNERFEESFADFVDKYHFDDMYSAGFYPFETPEEKWAFWSRYVYINRFKDDHSKLYDDLFKLVKDKNYFVITTNVDHLFQKSGFSKKRLFYTQGDFGLFQCSEPCHNKTYDNEKIIERMVREQKDMKIPSELIPYCPRCHRPMSMNLRADNTFVQDKGWYKAQRRYSKYLKKYANQKILFLDLGIGWNTPGIIKVSFWEMTLNNPKALYACINTNDAVCPEQILDRAILIDGNIKEIIEELLKK